MSLFGSDVMRHINTRQPIVNLSNEGYILIHLNDYLQTVNVLSRSVYDILPVNANLRNVCSSVVNINYIEAAIDNCIAEDPNNRKFDIVLLVKTMKLQTTSKKAYLFERKGILISEVGECNQHPYENTPVLKVICSGDNKGKYLMYAYIQAMLYKYTNATNLETQSYYNTGLLELANNYENIQGLCLYNKFGFKENIQLQSIRCLNQNYHNNSLLLPMSVDITSLTYDIVDEIVENKRIEGDEPLCHNIFKTNTYLQNKEIIRRMNIFKTQPTENELKDSKNMSQHILNTLKKTPPTEIDLQLEQEDIITQSLLEEKNRLRNTLAQIRNNKKQISKNIANNKELNKLISEKYNNTSKWINNYLNNTNNNNLYNHHVKNKFSDLRKSHNKTNKKRIRNHSTKNENNTKRKRKKTKRAPHNNRNKYNNKNKNNNNKK